MLYWKQYSAALIGLSVLALAGCGQSSGSGGPAAAGPNDADKAAIESVKQNGGQPPAAQAAAAKAKAAPAASTTRQ